MAVIEERGIWIKANEGAVGDGLFSVTLYNPSDRLNRAAKALGISWGLAVLALITFIPVVHLVLAIGLLIAGPITAYGLYRTSITANHVTGVCPACQQDMKLALQPAEHLPMWKYCPKCTTPLHIDAR